MKSIVRKPVQTRSMETKQKIINSSYDLFSSVGYYNTNTAEIAKNAGVSTGIVYGYFKNKKDILLDVVDIYKEKVTAPIFNLISNLSPNFDLEQFINSMINAVMDIHKNNTHIHEALHSIAHTDKQINEKFIEIEDEISTKLYQKLVLINFNCNYLNENIHIAMNLIQSFSHEYIYDKHEYLDYEALKRIISKTILKMFSE